MSNDTDRVVDFRAILKDARSVLRLADRSDAWRDERDRVVRAIEDALDAPSNVLRPPNGKPMDLTIWTGIREYIAAEIALADARRELLAMQTLGANAGQQDAQRAHIAALEEQSSRMETSVREAL